MPDIISGFRQAIQDLLVPELKALQVEVKHQGEAINGLRGDIKELRTEMAGLREEMNQRFETMQTEMNKRFETMHEENMDLKIGQREIIAKLDFDKRVTKLKQLSSKF